MQYLAVLLCLIAIGTTVGVLQAQGRSSRAAAFVPPIVDAGYTPAQDAQTVENNVLNAWGPNSTITKVYVLAHQSEVPTYVSSAFAPEGPGYLDGPVWLVTGRGVVARVSSVSATDPVTPIGDVYFVVDDTDGTVLAGGGLPANTGCSGDPACRP
jgi:hypothetical protein